MKLNIGCGFENMYEFKTLDINEDSAPDYVHDLNVFPYPFKDNSVCFIRMRHVLEHLKEPFKVIKELHRILKPGSNVIIKVPHWKYDDFGNPLHVSFFSTKWFKRFDPQRPEFCAFRFDDGNLIQKNIPTFKVDVSLRRGRNPLNKHFLRPFEITAIMKKRTSQNN